MILIRTIRHRMRSYTNYLYYWKRWGQTSKRTTVGPRSHSVGHWSRVGEAGKGHGSDDGKESAELHCKIVEGGLSSDAVNIVNWMTV